MGPYTRIEPYIDKIRAMNELHKMTQKSTKTKYFSEFFSQKFSKTVASNCLTRARINPPIPPAFNKVFAQKMPFFEFFFDKKKFGLGKYFSPKLFRDAS